MPAVFHCSHCQQSFKVDSLIRDDLSCSVCHGKDTALVTGREYHVKSMEWADQAPEVPGEWFLHFSHLHGVRHTQRVHIHSRRLACLLEWPAADPHLLLKAALWHDIGRYHDGFEPEHGGNSVLRARELGLTQSLSAADTALVKFAMRQHSLEDARSERAAGAEDEPQRALRILYLLKDADALDRVRLPAFEWPRVELLHHRCAVDSLEFAHGLLGALG